ncbi:MAG: Maf family nucleotide pyrophosphatase [Rhodospirillaceae bacterium]
MAGVILASGSAVRRRLLAEAGVDFATETADENEAEIKNRMRNDGCSVDDTALSLARAKAEAVARKHAGVYVIGADQMLEQGGRWFDKPEDRAEARRHLQSFSGRSHRLITAVSVVAGGAEVWHTVETATLHVRELSNEFIDDYLDAVGDAASASVGAYQLESLGIQLFERIDGDYFTILGLPLVRLLAFLRQHGLMAA